MTTNEGGATTRAVRIIHQERFGSVPKRGPDIEMVLATDKKGKEKRRNPAVWQRWEGRGRRRVTRRQLLETNLKKTVGLLGKGGCS
jgi:hypothetical protein